MKCTGAPCGALCLAQGCSMLPLAQAEDGGVASSFAGAVQRPLSTDQLLAHATPQGAVGVPSHSAAWRGHSPAWLAARRVVAV